MLFSKFMALYRPSLTRTSYRTFAAKTTKTAKSKKKEDNSTYGVYLWARMPRLGPKAGAVGT